MLTFERKERKHKRDLNLRLTALPSKPQSYFKEEIPTQAKTSETDSVMEIYEPFLSYGFVSLNSDYGQSILVKILRDTGASQSLILTDTPAFL